MYEYMVNDKKKIGQIWALIQLFLSSQVHKNSLNKSFFEMVNWMLKNSSKLVFFAHLYPSNSIFIHYNIF